MSRKRSFSLRSHILTLVVLASGLAVGVFTALITYVNTHNSIAELDSRLATLGDVIGQNSTAALDFTDKKAASETLAALRHERQVISACLYDAKGSLFSEYERDGAVAPCARELGTKQQWRKSSRYVVRPIRRSSDFLGSIAVTADMMDLERSNLRMLAIAIGLAFVSFIIAGFTGTFLQRRISQPVIELAAAMDRITNDGSLTCNVNVRGAQEIVHLADGFNRMVVELERRQDTARKAEIRLFEQARTDALTGLPNRRYLAEKLERELLRSTQENSMIALLCIDLDGFKLVNDSLGHAIGDLLLCEVGKRLKSHIRSTDTLARLGGDEFTVVLTGISSKSDATTAANSLIQSLSRPFHIEGNEISVGASIGISTRESSGMHDVDLLKQADSAMYAAKRAGKHRAVHFSPDLGNMARERLTLENELRGAIARGEIYVDYQPEWDAQSGRLLRFEALARWRHPRLGEISPATFIPVAEESGLIHALGKFVAERACKECLEWQKISPYPIGVAVNVSSLQFNSDRIVEEFSSVLRRSGLKPELLQLELTESVMVGSLTHTAEKMTKLRSLGISLVIDDFGTGYSCLGYLPALPFSALKIDRTFTRRLQLSPEVATMIRSLIEMSRRLGLRVIVEGIEEPWQLHTVRAMGADELQGYLFGLPSNTPRTEFADSLVGAPLTLNEAFPTVVTDDDAAGEDNPRLLPPTTPKDDDDERLMAEAKEIE